MDFVTDTSSVPDPHIFNQILSPLAISASRGIYDDYYELADALLAFAKSEGLLPYDQTLGGRFVEYLMQFESYPEDHPDAIRADHFIMLCWHLYDEFCIVNDTAAEGGYYTEVITRDDNTVLRANLTSFATGNCKDAIVALADFHGAPVADLGGGPGTILQTCQRMSNCDFSSYVNVDLQPNDKVHFFAQTVQKFQHDVGSMRQPKLNYLNQDMNDFLTVVDVDTYYLSIHSYYYMCYSARDQLFIHRKFAGVVHVSDLLFDGVASHDDIDASLVLNDNRMTGQIGAYRVVDEPMIFIDELPNFYPARFLNSLRNVIMQSTFVSSSLGFWSPALSVVSHDIAAKKGRGYKLVPANGYTHMKRTKIHELDSADFYFLRKIGYYLSVKIDGVCGFLHYLDGVYILGLRDGVQFVVLNPDDTSPDFGKIDINLNVELLYDRATKLFQIWFVSNAPPSYPNDSPVSQRNFWCKQFVSFAQTIETAKNRYHGLFFKDYHWVPPSKEIDYVVPSWPPIDGFVFHDPYGYFQGYWKPYHSADLWVRKKFVGRSGSLIAEIHSKQWDVQDLRQRFIKDGIYEVSYHEGQLDLIQPRSEKFNRGVVPFLNRNDLFDLVDDVVTIPGAIVHHHFGDYFDYFDSYGANYRAVMANVSAIRITTDEAKQLYSIIKSHLQDNAKKYEGKYLAADFITAICQKFSYEPQRLWLTFIRENLIDPRYNPYEPVVGFFDEFRAVVEIL